MTVNERAGRPAAELPDQDASPRLTVYLASAPGAGKTRRLLDEALRLQASGARVMLGWLETKNRADLDTIAAQLPRLPAKIFHSGSAEFADFDVARALELKPQIVILDELNHANGAGAPHGARWEDALALRDAGISVIGAFDIAHLETIAPTAETIIGVAIGDTVPLAFLRAADQVVALDVSSEQLEARLQSGKVVPLAEVERARSTIFRPHTLRYLREVMLHTVDDLTDSALTPRSTSTAVAFATGDGDTEIFLRKSAALAHAFDLALDVAIVGERDIDAVGDLSKELDAHVVPLSNFDSRKPQLAELKATLVTVPCGELAMRIVSRALDRDVFVADPSVPPGPVQHEIAFSRYAKTSGDRLRIGYGRLTIYLGAAAGSGTTYAMLDRAHQLAEAGIDVAGGLIETHGRPDTARKALGLEILPRRIADCDGAISSELDLDALLSRRPAVALIDELAHTNAPCDAHQKRYDDVLQVLRAGISVVTTLNVQHLEGLSDAVLRLTGRREQERVPDEILELADEVILIDTTPQTLRERLRAGKIYEPAQIANVLAQSFKTENLGALRELALREVVRARGAQRPPPPFRRLVLGVKARERDVELIERCARIALRLEIEMSVVHAARAGEAAAGVLDALRDATRRAHARWVVETGSDAAAALLAGAAREGGSTLAVEGARHQPRWPLGVSFARRLLEAGARQVLVLSPP